MMLISLATGVIVMHNSPDLISEFALVITTNSHLIINIHDTDILSTVPEVA